MLKNPPTKRKIPITTAARNAMGWTKRYNGTPARNAMAARMKYILEEICCLFSGFGSTSGINHH
jgi:hypothetical protein